MVFDVLPAPVDIQTLQKRCEILDQLENRLASQPQWHECESAAEYRKMRREGHNGFIATVLNPNARITHASARDGHEIELRIIHPTQGQSKGVWLHFHAGKCKALCDDISPKTMTMKYAYLCPMGSRGFCYWK